MTDATPADRSQPISLVPDPNRDRLGAPLPTPLSSFVGREREVAAVANLLRQGGVHLVTLTGPGGVGKTRLALAVAEELGGTFADGVAFVDLTPVADPQLVLPTLAQALAVRESPGQPLGDRLAAALANRRSLLVFDNFEQVLAAAPVVPALLDRCPGVKALVTSRVTLHVSGEQEFPVSPLSLPGPRAKMSPADLERNPAVALFVQRSRAVQPRFAVTPENAPAIAEICRRLDGLPLALELAAARAKILAPQALLHRLSHRLQVLTGGLRNAPTRQRTLRDAIAWSHDLLAPDEQALFRRLAVFAGGFTLEAAEAVSGPQQAESSGQPAEEYDPVRSALCSLPAALSVLDGLSSLADSSLLVQRQQADGELRFSMLETVREFGLERLEASGETDAVRGAHAAWCLELAKQAGPILLQSNAAIWLDRLELEHPNLRAALAWAAAFDPAAGLRLADALWPFWFVRGHLAEGRGWLERALDQARDIPGAAAVRPNALYGAGLLAWTQGDYPRAVAHHEEGVATSRALGDDLGIAAALFGLGDIARRRGADDEAVTRFEEALGLFREAGDLWWIAMSLNGLGFVAGRRGDYERATAFLEEALLLFRRIGSEWGSAEALAYAGWVARDAGHGARAVTLMREATALFWRHGDRRSVAQGLYLLASIAGEGGHADLAARLLGAVEALREPIGAVLLTPDGADYEQTVASLRAALGEDAFAAAWAVGRDLTIEQALDDAAGAATPAVAAPPPSPDLSTGGLTPREREVLRLLTAGDSNREIAAALFISERTVGSHVGSILRKLGLQSRSAAALHALRHGLA